MIVIMAYLPLKKNDELLLSEGEIIDGFERLELESEEQRKIKLFDYAESSKPRYEVRITEDTVTTLSKSD